MTGASERAAAEHDVEARLLRLESLEAIRSLVQQYSFDVDDHNFDRLAERFAEDSRYRSVDGRIDVSGRADIHAYFRQRMAQLGSTCHVTHDHVIDLDAANPATARGKVISHAEVVADGRPMCTCLRYVDEYVFEAGRWRFRERVMHFMYFCPIDEYPRVLNRRRRKFMGGRWFAADLPESIASWSGQRPGSSRA